MARKRFTVESIVAMLREADVMIGKGLTVPEILKQLNLSDATYYKWRKEYGGLKVDQARKYKELEAENQKLKKIIADLSIDNAILREYQRLVK